MKINYIFRNGKSGYSIQSVFQTIVTAVRHQVEVKEIYLPSPLASFASILKNGLYARKQQNQQAINHITGDVHYLLYFLNARRTVVTVHDIMYYHYLKGLKNALEMAVYCLFETSFPSYVYF